jgi:ribosomal protein S6--L-glutamate ligase
MYGSLGHGVERLDDDADGRVRAHALLVRYRSLYLQRFVTAEHDVRAFVVGGEVAAAMSRQAPPGEFRGNLRLGARARPFALDAATAHLAARAAAAVGLDYSGVDLLLGVEGPQIVEVNGTPAFRGILEATGRDMAEEIVAYATMADRAVEQGRAQWRTRGT